MDLHPCKRTGACCRGRGFTPLSADDVTRLAARLSISEVDFRAEYADRFEGRTVLKNRFVPGEEPRCVLLKGNDCSVHDVKPEACAKWPLWPKLYEDAAHYGECQTYCGMIRGIPHGDFKKIYRPA